MSKLIPSQIFIFQIVVFLILKSEEDNSGCYFTDRMMRRRIMKNGYVRSHVTDLKTMSDLFPQAAQKDWNSQKEVFFFNVKVFYFETLHLSLRRGRITGQTSDCGPVTVQPSRKTHSVLLVSYCHLVAAYVIAPLRKKRSVTDHNQQVIFFKCKNTHKTFRSALFFEALFRCLIAQTDWQSSLVAKIN